MLEERVDTSTDPDGAGQAAYSGAIGGVTGGIGGGIVGPGASATIGFGGGSADLGGATVIGTTTSVSVTISGGAVTAGAATLAGTGNIMMNGGPNDLPSIDSTGKVHGELPSLKDCCEYDPDDLRILLGELEQSVRERIRKNIQLGNHKPHGQRQAAEQDLTHRIKKCLGL